MKLRRPESLLGYLLVLPMLVGFLLFVLGPLVAVLVYSFQDRNLLSGQSEFIGLEGYRDMIADPLFLQSLRNSVVFTIGLVTTNIALALGLAIALNNQLRRSTFFQFVFFVPVTISAVAWAITWKFMLQPEAGFINQALSMIGITGPNWLQEGGWAMFAVIITRTLKNVGINMILFLAGLQAIPSEVIGAAEVDGASKSQIYGRVVLPLLAPTLLLVSILTVIGSFKVFDHIFLLTQGGPENSTIVLVYYIYFQAFQAFDTGYAARLAVVLLVIILGLTAAQWQLRKRLDVETQ